SAQAQNVATTLSEIQAIRELGLQLYLSKKYQEALSKFEHAKALCEFLGDSNNPDYEWEVLHIRLRLHTDIAIVLSKTKKSGVTELEIAVGLAQDAIKRGVSLRPVLLGHIEVLYANELDNQGRTSEAITLYESALKNYDIAVQEEEYHRF